jgi:hypothetical protein
MLPVVELDELVVPVDVLDLTEPLAVPLIAPLLRGCGLIDGVVGVAGSVVVAPAAAAADPLPTSAAHSPVVRYVPDTES